MRRILGQVTGRVDELAGEVFVKRLNSLANIFGEVSEDGILSTSSVVALQGHSAKAAFR